MEYTFSNGEKLLYRNYKGLAVYDDIAYADSDKMPTYIKTIEDNISGKGTINAQSIGLNPGGCSARFIFCTVYTSAYLWSGRQINYYFGAGWSKGEIDNVLQPQIDEWNRSGVVMQWNRVPTLVNGGGPVVVINPVSDPSYCGLASIGFQGKVAFAGGNFINIQRNGYCEQAYSGSLQHEMGHVVGLPHEQTRFDRDKYVTLGANANQSGIRRGEYVSTFGQLFDYNSIMLYDTPSVYAKYAAPGTYQGTNPYDAKDNPTGSFARKAHLSSGDVFTINSIYRLVYK